MDDADLTDLRAEREEALRRRVREAREREAATRAHPTHCVDCHDPLPAARIALGAKRCVECERAAEHEQARRNQLFRRGYEY